MYRETVAESRLISTSVKATVFKSYGEGLRNCFGNSEKDYEMRRRRDKASRKRFLGELKGFHGRGGQGTAVQSKAGHPWVLNRTLCLTSGSLLVRLSVNSFW